MEDEKLIELAKLVKEMREVQTAYFRTRHKNHLDRSKMLESQVDGKVEEILNPNNQITLF